MSVYTPNPASNPTSFTFPADGEFKNAASVLAGLQGLADKAAHMNLPEQDLTKTYPLASQQFLRVQTSDIFASQSNAPPALDYYADVDGVWTALSTGSNTFTRQRLRLPHGATNLQIYAFIQGAPGHSVAIPSAGIALPVVYLRQTNIDTGAAGALVFGPDGSATRAAYEARHYMNLLTYAGPIDNTLYDYSLVVVNEYGADSKVGLRYCGCKVVGTIVNLDSAGC